MTLNALEFWRKAVPFAIAAISTVPWMVARAQSLGECALIMTVALAAGFLYVILGMRGPSWRLEMDRYVNTQIRDDLVTLIPQDIHVTAAEREQLKNSQIVGELSGVFWETIDKSAAFRSHKDHFYSNGLAYSTAFDGFFLCTVFGLCYISAAVILKDARLFSGGGALIAVGLLCRGVGVPARRRHHLNLSREQLDLLRNERSDLIADRFRQIVLGWRKQGRPAGVVPPRPRERSVSRKELLVACCVVAAFCAFVLISRGWLGAGPGVKLAPEVRSAYVTEGSHNKYAAVVFVHGIFGTKDDTWLSADHKATFPQLLATDPVLKDKLDVFAFEYFTPKFGAAPSIVDLADQLRGDLDDHHVFEDHQRVVFLAHSMGGLVVREYLLNHQDRFSKVPMVFFYATPTNGAEMAKVGQLVSVNPQLRGMVPIEGNDLLQSIQSGWMNSSKAKSIASYCGVEELPTDGIMIVTRSSATSLCNQPLDPFSASHIDIVKPPNREDSRYTRFVSALQKDVLAANSEAAVTPAASTSGHSPATIAEEKKSQGEGKRSAFNNGRISKAGKFGSALERPEPMLTPLDVILGEITITGIKPVDLVDKHVSEDTVLYSGAPVKWSFRLTIKSGGHSQTFGPIKIRYDAFHQKLVCNTSGSCKVGSFSYNSADQIDAEINGWADEDPDNKVTGASRLNIGPNSPIKVSGNGKFTLFFTLTLTKGS